MNDLLESRNVADLYTHPRLAIRDKVHASLVCAAVTEQNSAGECKLYTASGTESE